MRLLGGLARKLEKPRHMEMKSKMILRKARKKDMMIAGKGWSPLSGSHLSAGTVILLCHIIR